MLKAAWYGNLDVVSGVLQRAAEWELEEDVTNATTDQGQSALYLAILNKNEEMAMYLISKNALINTVSINKYRCIANP